MERTLPALRLRGGGVNPMKACFNLPSITLLAENQLGTIRWLSAETFQPMDPDFQIADAIFVREHGVSVEVDVTISCNRKRVWHRGTAFAEAENFGPTVTNWFLEERRRDLRYGPNKW